MLDTMVDVWQLSRDNIEDDDYMLFIHENTEKALKLIKDLQLTDGNITSKKDEVLITFIMKLKALCD